MRAHKVKNATSSVVEAAKKTRHLPPGLPSTKPPRITKERMDMEIRSVRHELQELKKLVREGFAAIQTAVSELGAKKYTHEQVQDIVDEVVRKMLAGEK